MKDSAKLDYNSKKLLRTRIKDIGLDHSLTKLLDQKLCINGKIFYRIYSQYDHFREGLYSIEAYKVD